MSAKETKEDKGSKNGKGVAKGSAAAKLKEEKASFKYNVDNLAEQLGIEPSSARVALRKAKIKKAGRAYGWNNKSDFEDVVKKLKSEKKEAKKSDDE